MGAELFHADRRTDMTKLVVAFRNFADALNEKVNCYSKFDIRAEEKVGYYIFFFNS